MIDPLVVLSSKPTLEPIYQPIYQPTYQLTYLLHHSPGLNLIVNHDNNNNNVGKVGDNETDLISLN